MPEIMFAGPDGRLEGRYVHAKAPNAPLAVMLHPHPRQGGNMNNRIVHSLGKTFEGLGFSVLRFNFRGVGRSQGVWDGGIGELSDAAAALDWMQSLPGNAAPQAVWVAGYSFGAYVGMQLLMRRPEVTGFVSIAPPAAHYDFGFLAPCPCSGLVIHGGRDELSTEPATAKLIAKLNTQKGIRMDYRVFAEADHFFIDQCDAISAAVTEHVGRRMRRDLPLAAD